MESKVSVPLYGLVITLSTTKRRLYVHTAFVTPSHNPSTSPLLPAAPPWPTPAPAACTRGTAPGTTTPVTPTSCAVWTIAPGHRTVLKAIAAEIRVMTSLWNAAGQGLTMASVLKVIYSP